MRTSAFYKYFSPVLLTLLISCIQNDDFNAPFPEIPGVEITGTEITIAALRDALIQEANNNGNPVLTYEKDNYIAAYVISNDQQGNFFEEIIIQNSPTEPVTGVKVLIDASPLFPSYEFGRKVYVKLEGLSVSFNSGQLTLGIRNGNKLGPIAESQRFDFVIRDPEVAVIEAVDRDISDLNDALINTYVKLNNVQFAKEQVLGDNPLTYAGEPEDQFDGERILESCAEGNNIVFSTSTFAEFKSVQLPAGRGTVEGVFTYNFFGDEFNIVVNDLNGVQLEGEERCDPEVIDCGLASVTGDNVLFSEFFENQNAGNPISGNGWTNYIEAGTETWEAYFDDGTNASLGISARMGSYSSGDPSSIGWLITPQIDFDNQDGETLNFRTSNSFSDGSALELLFSSDWDGEPANVTSATWELLPSAVIVADDDFFGDWIFSGIADLSCIDGSGHIAWKYVGSGDEAFDGTYELDEIEIKSN